MPLTKFCSEKWHVQQRGTERHPPTPCNDATSPSKHFLILKKQDRFRGVGYSPWEV